MKRVLLIILDILLIIVCVYFGILGYLFKDEYKEKTPEIHEPVIEEPIIPTPKPEEPELKPSEVKIPTITEAKYDSKVSGVDENLEYNKYNMDEMTLHEAFSLKKLNRDLITFTKIVTLKDGEMSYTGINGITILIWSDGFISNVSKDRTAKSLKSSSGNTVSVGKINNYYIVTVSYSGKNKLIMYDLKFKKVLDKEVNYNALPTLYKSYIFYGIDACNKPRFDGSKGSVIQVYSFGTYSGVSNNEFNIDNNNGTCK